EDSKQRLADLGERLRQAHASMDGGQIRELSTEQHGLIGELTRAAFEAADIKSPSPALRDDLAGTLQAAIADSEISARLGRLVKAERWSGFGTFGDAAPVSTAARAATASDQAVRSRPKPATRERPDRDERQRLEKLRAAVTAARSAKAEAEQLLSERQAARAAARLSRDEALAGLRKSERELAGAEARVEEAKRASRAATESLSAAKAQLKQG